MYLYKHQNNTDIAFEILRKFYIKEKDAYSLRVRWYRVRADRVLWCFNIEERLKIARKVLSEDWHMYDYKTVELEKA